ncbi:MAG: tetratricopeptide repeat protein, partial [Anaerolineaceae bacterium]|nr:tetratricopeptide repeat protein [Anaerolineaceae bacterium]
MTNRHSEQLQQAIELIGQGQLEEAQDILIDIVQEDPNNEDAWICLADTVDNLDEKIGIFSNCLEKAPNSFIVRKEYEKCLIEKSRQTQEDHVPDENLPEIVYGYQDASPESEEDTSSTDALQWLFNEIDGKTPPEDADADRPDSEELEETEEAEGADESGDEEEEPSESPFTELRADLEDASDFSGEDLRDLFNDHHEQDAQAFEMGYIAGTPPRKPFMEEDLIDITNPFEEDDSTDGLPDVMGRISSDYQKAAHEEENGGEFEKWEELTASIEDQSQIDLDDTNPALDLHEWIKENPFSTTEELEGLDEEALKKVHEFTQSVNTLNQDESSLADATDEELSSELDSLLEGLSEPDDEDSIDSKELNQKLLHVNAFFDDEEEEEDILQLHHDENSLLTGTPPFNIDLAPRDFNQIKDELELESDDEGGEFMLEDELDSDILPEELPTDQPKQSADEPNIDVSYDDDVDLEDLSEIETLGDSDQFQPVSKPKIVVEYGEAINPEDLYFEVSGNDYGSGLRANIYDEEDMEDEESLPSEADRAMENEVGMSLDVDTLE